MLFQLSHSHNTITNRPFYIQWLFKILGVRDFNLPPKIQEWLAEVACEPKLGEELCSNVAFLLCGFDKAQLNEASAFKLVLLSLTKPILLTLTVNHYIQF